MKKYFKYITYDKAIKLGFSATLVIIPFMFMSILFFYKRLPPLIPVFNQLPWGEQRLGSKGTIFIPFAIVILVFISNLIVSSIMYTKNPLTSRILAITSLLVAILTFIFTLKTIFELV